ncbi:MAG: S9 family peptidase [Candidatus Bathyarchaeota archaeon]|nr:MAG: S9 family peptidase [Candidatus Bathyarchaeota archaeon]
MKKLEDYKIMPLFASTPVGDPQVSPDGGRILFTHSTIDMKEDKYRTHIWLQDLGEKNPRQFTYGAGSESYPRWSPDGKEVLFLTNREGIGKNDKKPTPQIYVLRADGGEARKVTDMEEGVQRPEWSPNGRSILFLSRVFKGEKMDGESDVKVIRRVKYRFDAQGYFVEKYTHLFTVPAKGGKAKQLTEGLYDVESPVWSPDANRIAFVSNLDEDGDISRYKHIYVVPVKGGAPEVLLRWNGTINSISWSTCRGYIAFIGRIIEDPSLVWHKNNEVFLLPVEGGEPKYLTGDLDRTVSGAALKWSPESGGVYFKINDHGETHICRVDLDGAVERVTEGKMMVGDYSIDGSGSLIAFNCTDSATPYELWIRDGKGQRRLTELTKGFMRKQVISEPEEFWFTASDGAEVQGWIIKPHGYEEGEKYPTLFEVHGGPRGAYGYSYGAANHEFQVLAGHGYAVAYTNPRGSTGFGEEFAGVISGHWGERDYMDVMEAVDHVTGAYHYVDGDRLGILGGSYGGYMTNWVVGHTDRFKAAVTMRGISNWYSMMGTSDIGWQDHDVSWGKNAWENLDEIMSKSPISYLGNVTTPLLIIHSENDFRCPVEQDEQMFIGLKKQGKETEFVRFPDESHGLSRGGKPKHRLERLRHIVRWFDRYLKGDE